MFPLSILRRAVLRPRLHQLPFSSCQRFCCYYKQPVSPCRMYDNPVEKKPCFDINKVEIIRANTSHAEWIKSFLNAHYWPREPSVVGLWMDLNSTYLKVLTEKYAHSGDRLLALEKLERTGEYKLVGVAVANKIFPWAADELEEWAHYTASRPEQHRMYFCAHLLKSPNLFKKYNVDYIYEVEVLATSAEVTGHGLGAKLLRAAMANATELRHPLVQVIAVSAYTSKICEKVGMKRAWKMDYSEFVDNAGQRVFYPRRPHSTVAIYVKPFSQYEAQGFPPCP